MRPFTFTKTIILTLSAMLAVSCVEPLQNNNSGNTPSVTLADIKVKAGTKYVTLSAAVSNPSAVKTAGFYVSEDESMSSPRKIDAEVGKTITAEYLPDGYGRTYYVKAFIGNGQTEKCTEVKQFTIGSLDSYVSLSATLQSMTSSSAMVKAVLTVASGVNITSKGFCYGEKEDVTIADNVIEVTSSEFKAEVPCRKQIYIRSYVKDGDEVAYSDPVVGVQVESITLDKEVVDINVGESVTLTATVLPATATDKAVTWSSSDGKVATVTDGKVTAVGNGTATITATSGGKSATCAVTVTTKATGVQLNKTSLSLTVGESETLTATVLPATATDKAVTWSSSNEKVVTVTAGKVTAVGNGTATITATSGGKSATCEVTVTTKATGVQLNKTSLSLNVGESETLTATVLPATATDKAVTWSSSDGKVATVTAGKVTAVGNGTATITATCNGKSATCAVNVTTKSTGVQLNKTSLSLNVGESETLTATVLPSTATDKSVTWSSSNENVATVTAGKVTAVGNGTATITAKNGSNTATCAVNVTTKSTGVQLNKTSLSLNVGESETLTATVLPATATDKAVMWSSSNPSVAAVSTSGKVIAQKAGTATITVKTIDGGDYTATCKVTVNGPINGHEYVDLGLSVKWATCNVGATKPEDYGGYYQWGGTKDVTSTSIYLGWISCPYHAESGSSSSTGWTKYNTKSSYGMVDNKTVLDLSDDVAHVNWGGSWRMPTYAEWTELRENCTWTWTTLNGVYGYRVTRPSYTGESIFLPAAGWREYYDLEIGHGGHYWSSSLDSDEPRYACKVNFASDVVNVGSFYRYLGLSVRPVSE